MPRDAENPDDDALHWGGDDIQAPSLPPARRAPTRVAPMAPSRASAGPAQRDAPAGEPGPAPRAGGAEEPAELSNVALVSLGLLGGVYLLFTVGWIIGGLRLQQRSAVFAGDPMYIGALWLAVLAPAAWFVLTFVLTRGRAVWLRMIVLLAGVVLLVPWPFLSAGAVTL